LLQNGRGLILKHSYESWCSGDAGEVIQFNYQLIFCKAYHSGQVLTAMPTLTGIPLAPTAGAVDAPTNAPIVPKNIGGKKSDAVAFSIWPTALTYATATLLGLVFLLL
jgi:hypothetical protein